MNLWYDRRVMDDSFVGPQVARCSGSSTSASPSAATRRISRLERRHRLTGMSRDELTGFAAREVAGTLVAGPQRPAHPCDVVREKKQATFSRGHGSPSRPSTRTPSKPLSPRGLDRHRAARHDRSPGISAAIEPLSRLRIEDWGLGRILSIVVLTIEIGDLGLRLAIWI